MKPFKIITDGSADLPEALVRENDITLVPFYVLLDDGAYKKQGADITTPEFYDWMIAHPRQFPKSSAPSPDDFIAAFAAAAQAGCDVLCICITDKFSSSYQNACVAKMLMEDDYPDAAVMVVNSTVNTVLQGQLVLEACRLRDAGLPLAETAAQLETVKATGRIFFTIGGMEYLQVGGRIGKLAGKVATRIGIRPIITLREGEIHPSGVALSRGKSLEQVLRAAGSYVQSFCQSTQKLSFCVGYGADREEAVGFGGRVEELLHGMQLAPTVPLRQIGAVIGVHTGPYPLGIGVLQCAAI